MPRSQPTRRLSATSLALSWLLAAPLASATGKVSPRAGAQHRLHPSADVCLPSPTVHAINNILARGGAGTAVVLCPNSRLEIDAAGRPITFTAPGQALYTLGFPEDDSRATIALVDPMGESGAHGLATVVQADCDACAGARVRSLVVDGGRRELGGVEGGGALIVIGGDGIGTAEVRAVEAREARGFAVVHISEGSKGLCHGASVTDSFLHSSGDEPTDASLAGELLALRDGPPPWRGQERAGLFTDGLSVACANAFIHGNIITDVSGVGIALRGAYSSQVTGNSVTARGRDLLAGIALVANPKLVRPRSGGVVVRENRIHARSAFIRIGLAVGTGAWATDSLPGSHDVPAGSEVVSNRFSSDRGFFGYALAVSDAKGIVVEGNSISAVISGYQTAACYLRPQFALPTPLLRDPASSTGLFQKEFEPIPFGFLLCVGPGGQGQAGALARHQIGTETAARVTMGGRKVAGPRGAPAGPRVAPGGVAAAVSGLRVAAGGPRGPRGPIDPTMEPAMVAEREQPGRLGPRRVAGGPRDHLDGEWRRRAIEFDLDRPVMRRQRATVPRRMR